MIKIALTNLGKYNEGELDFVWLELPCTEEQIEDAMKAIGIDGVEYEEYFITDYESDLDIQISEYANLTNLNELAERITGVDEDLLIAIMESETSDLEQALDLAESGNASLYGAETLEELASEWIEDGMFSTETLLQYIDMEALARSEFAFSGYTETSKGVLYI